MNSAPRSRSFTAPRAIQNARTRIYIPGSDPLFSPAAWRSASRLSSRVTQLGSVDATEPRLFTPGLLDRLQTPLTRYTE
ncbi:MAG: hypothetical protein ABIZ04_18990 [Opitutus sp.]